MKLPKRIYYYRGRIEWGVRYEWRDGYSPSSDQGYVTYPWRTRSECRKEAEAAGFKAVFYRDSRA